MGIILLVVLVPILAFAEPAKETASEKIVGLEERDKKELPWILRDTWKFHEITLTAPLILETNRMLHGLGPDRVTMSWIADPTVFSSIRDWRDGVGEHQERSWLDHETSQFSLGWSRIGLKLGVQFSPARNSGREPIIFIGVHFGEE